MTRSPLRSLGEIQKILSAVWLSARLLVDFLIQEVRAEIRQGQTGPVTAAGSQVEVQVENGSLEIKDVAVLSDVLEHAGVESVKVITNDYIAGPYAVLVVTREMQQRIIDHINAKRAAEDRILTQALCEHPRVRFSSVTGPFGETLARKMTCEDCRADVTNQYEFKFHREPKGKCKTIST